MNEPRKIQLKPMTAAQFGCDETLFAHIQNAWLPVVGMVKDFLEVEHEGERYTIHVSDVR